MTKRDEATIVTTGQDKHFDVPHFWTEENHCHYLDSITLSDGTKYDVGVWVSEDKSSVSLTFLDSEDYTAYHSVTAYRQGKLLDLARGWEVSEGTALTAINQHIYKLAKEAGYFKGFNATLDLENPKRIIVRAQCISMPKVE